MLQARLFGLCLGLTLISSLASAGVTVNIDTQAGPVPGTIQYTLHLNSPDKVASVQARFWGPMYQVWNGSSPTVLLDDPAMAAINTAMDTHLLLNSADLTSVLRPAHEQGPLGSNQGLGDWFGYSQMISMAFGIAPGAQKTDLPFIQIITPADAGVHADLRLAANGQAAEQILIDQAAFTFTSGGPYVIAPGGTLNMSVLTPGSATYQWDLNQDMGFEVSGSSVQLGYATLQQMGLLPGHTYTVWIKGNNAGQIGWASTTLNFQGIVPEPATLLLLTAGAIGLRRRRSRS